KDAGRGGEAALRGGGGPAGPGAGGPAPAPTAAAAAAVDRADPDGQAVGEPVVGRQAAGPPGPGAGDRPGAGTADAARLRRGGRAAGVRAVQDGLQGLRRRHQGAPDPQDLEPEADQAREGVPAGAAAGAEQG